MKKNFTQSFYLMFGLLLLLPCLVSGQGKAKNTSKAGLIEAKRSSSASGIVKEIPLSTDQPIMLYGSMISSSDWFFETKYGAYSIETSNPAVFNQVYSSPDMLVYGSFYLDGKYYTIYKNASTGTVNYAVFDTKTWAQLSNKEIAATSLVADMTYDPLTEKTFAVTAKRDGTGLQLSSFNLQTAAMTTIGDVPQLVALTIGKDAVLYGIDIEGKLYSVNKNTAISTLIGSTGLFPANTIQSATYDSRTGKIYWSAYLDNYTSGIYTVNASTAEVSLVSQFSKNEEITGLYTTTPFVFSAAPDTVKDLSVLFESLGSTTGTISFTLPAKTYGGVDLSGTLTADLYVNNILVKTFSQAFGSTCEYKTDLGTGNKTIEVKVKNAVGTGLSTTLSLWSGQDIPSGISNLTFTKSANRSLTLNWEAPTKTQHGGYADFATVTYDIVRQPDNVTVATGISATTFTDNTMGADLMLYHYSVTPKTIGGAGASSTTDGVVLGDYSPIPFAENFNADDALTLWTIIDNNGGVTWRPFEGTAAYLLDYINEKEADDWLFSPAFKLNASKVYKLSFVANVPETSKVSENFKVTMGTSATIASQTTVLADYPNYKSSSSETKELKITVPSDGVYNFAFYEYSEPNKFRLMLDDVKLTEVGSVYAPNAVTSATIEPDKEGALSAKLSFVAPAVSYGDKPLSEITKIEIYRDGTDGVIATLDNPTPGAVLSYTDVNAVTGINTYRIVAINSNGAGPEVKLASYVGTDTPVAVGNQELKIVDGKVKISWTSPAKGTHDGYINPTALTYKIVDSNENVIAESITQTSFVDESLDLNGAQKFISYTIIPSSITAEGEGRTTNKLCIGKPLALPFSESFEAGEFSEGPWSIDWVSGAASSKWTVSESGENPDIKAKDADGGLVIFNSSETDKGSSSRLVTPAIDISSVANPKLSFWFYHYKDEYEETLFDDKLQVEISVDNAAFQNIGNEILLTSSMSGWKHYEIPLLPYRNSKAVNIAFKGISGYGYNIHLDSIVVTGYKESDLSVASFTGNKRVSVAEDEAYTVNVKNLGVDKTSNYKVSLYKDKNVISTQQGVLVNADETQQVVFYTTATLDEITEGDKYYAYYAKIEFSTDEELNNNTSDTIRVTVRKPTYTVASNLVATIDNKDVKLSWSAPAPRAIATSEAIVEDFESYAPYIIDSIGDWSLVDKDKLATLASPRIGDYAHKGAPMAYQVMKAIEDDEVFEAHSGSQYLVSTAANGGRNNDWLISPILPAVEQELSFWAKSATDLYGSERMIVLYSTTDKHPDSFTKLSVGDYVEVPTFWRNYKYTLPVGARYFAIQCVSNQDVMFFVDDVAFSKSTGDPEAINLLGYNVYCDGKLLNTTPLITNQFTDINKGNGSYVYKVTAVYDKGESVYSNEAAVNLTTDIASNYFNKVNVYGGKNVIGISNAAGSKIEIYTISGQLIYQTQGSQHLNIPSKSGMFVVKVGAYVSKVVVQ